MKKRIYIDVETSGLDPECCAITQLGGIIEIDGHEVERFNWRLRPFKGAIVEEGALSITGVSIEDLKSYPDQSIAWTEFITMLNKHCDKFNKQDKYHIVGYNCQKFDVEFLRAWFTRNGDRWYGSWFWPNTIDLYSICSLYLEPVREQLPDFKLSTVSSSILGSDCPIGQLHDAMYDIILTKALLDKIFINIKKSI